MAEYLIQEETLTSIADQIRILNGTEDTMSPSAMNTGLETANTEVGSQADLIDQIKTAVDNLPEAGSGDSGGSVDTCMVTLNSFNTIHYVGYTSLESGKIVAKVSSSSNNILLSNIVCGSAICFYNNYDFNGFSHSHDSTYIGRISRNMYVLSAPTSAGVNATITIFDDD